MEGLIKKKIREKKHSVCRVNIYPPNPPHCWEMEYLTRTREDESQDGHITPPPPRGLGSLVTLPGTNAVPALLRAAADGMSPQMEKSSIKHRFWDLDPERMCIFSRSGGGESSAFPFADPGS